MTDHFDRFYEAIRRRIRSAPGRSQCELLRQEISASDARLNKLVADQPPLAEKFIEERMEVGDTPSRGTKPSIDPKAEHEEQFYQSGGNTFLGVEVIFAVATALSAPSVPFPIRILAAVISVITAVLIAKAFLALVRSVFCGHRQPSACRPRLHRIVAVAGIVGVVSLLPLIIAQRGATQPGSAHGMLLAISIGFAGITLGFSIAAAACFLIARSYSQATARKYELNEHHIARERLFGQELRRWLANHPLRDDDDDDVPPALVPGG